MVILLLATAFIPLGLGDFILPEWGGGVVHQDLQMSKNIRLPVPTENVGELWYSHKLGGELWGSWGNGIVGNGRIAASTFNSPAGRDNLIIYDYYGKAIWSSGFLKNYSLNIAATFSSPMVDMSDRVVACDNHKIILVNASDHDNVSVDWVSEIPHEDGWIYPMPYSPCIIENKTIILPTENGPVLLYDVETGDKLAESKLGQKTHPSGVTLESLRPMSKEF